MSAWSRLTATIPFSRSCAEHDAHAALADLVDDLVAIEKDVSDLHVNRA